MRRFVRGIRRIAAALALLAASAIPVAQAAGTATVVVVVRHAEKVADGSRDPALTAVGRARAAALADALASLHVAHVYATPYRRTRDTAAPTAAVRGLPVDVRAIADGDVDAYVQALRADILAHHRGETVLVVGHSNTVPQTVAALCRCVAAPMDEREYDRLSMVVLDGDAARLVVARYGAPSP
ncbi:MAG: phosphoglycerate mutase family protein [Mizugakiibacter sp.]|uniref:SixA phosphatase family protein n=1 Tax=Mizugakiibacter sp. TaxID=1972610 RepID=UPI0031C04126|nr:histidine phosphatase family protein [Xanthomonadaceae bacterium]